MKIQRTGIVQYFEIAIIYLLRAIKKMFYIFPICENRIIFISQRGSQYSCNPKYIRAKTTNIKMYHIIKQKNNNE